MADGSANLGALASVSDQEILHGIQQGKSLRDLAAQYHVSNVAIYRRASKHPEYREHMTAALTVRMEQRESELEAAAESVSVTRADRLLGHARWLAERCAPDVYGQKNQLHVSGSLTLDMLLEAAEPQDVVSEQENARLEQDPGAPRNDNT